MKARANERLEFNAAYGIDNAFAHQIRPSHPLPPGAYQNLARNSTWFSNVIYSPTAYTLFSFKYRRIIAPMRSARTRSRTCMALPAAQVLTMQTLAQTVAIG